MSLRGELIHEIGKGRQSVFIISGHQDIPFKPIEFSDPENHARKVKLTPRRVTHTELRKINTSIAKRAGFNDNIGVTHHLKKQFAQETGFPEISKDHPITVVDFDPKNVEYTQPHVRKIHFLPGMHLAQI